MANFSQHWLTGEWATPEYQLVKQQNFEIVDKYVNTPLINVLDIGCGLAWESRLFSKKYGCELWLIDGSSDDNDKKDAKAADAGYHQTKDEFLFYNSLDTLNEELTKLGTTNFKLLDCNNLKIPDDTKFDLITSWLSCGFHYPVSTYRDLILKHSHENTKVIVDLRTQLKTKEIILEEGVEIIEILSTHRKHVNAHIRFI
jgi:SAM-dependent methyltransferase